MMKNYVKSIVLITKNLTLVLKYSIKKTVKQFVRHLCDSNIPNSQMYWPSKKQANKNKNKEVTLTKNAQFVQQLS